MDTQNDNIEDLIAKTIRKAGYEKDMRDLETLKAFMADISSEETESLPRETNSWSYSNGA